VQLRQRSYGMIENKHTEQRSHQLRAYCATTQTGFFLARSHDQIFVTGNTGRFSGDGGFNFANLRRTSPIRGAITAPNGYKIVHRDSSQIEARMVAWMAGCIQLLDAFAEGRDIYSEFASDVYGRSITKADKLERFVGKTATLGLSYGLGWEKFRHTLYIGNGGVSVDVSDAFAAQVVSHYRHTYYQIPRLWQNATVMLRSMIHDGSPYEPGTRVPFVEHVEPIPGITPGIEALWLPNGLCIAYPELREEIVNASTGRRAQLGYTGTRKQFVNLHGGKCVENMSQALARIVVTDISLRVKAQTGYHPIMMTYDSLDYCLPADQAEAMDALLAREFAVRPVWASTLPLASEGGWGVTLADAERGVNT
jgi:DNA polymerase